MALTRDLMHQASLDRCLAGGRLRRQSRTGRSLRHSREFTRAMNIQSLLRLGLLQCPARRHANRFGWIRHYRRPPSLGGTERVATWSSQIAQLRVNSRAVTFEGRLQFHERGSDRLTCGYTLKPTGLANFGNLPIA